jgi:exosortase
MIDRKITNSWWFCAAVLFFPAAYLWVPYSGRMWRAGHYQYFPLIFIAVGALLWQRRHVITAARTSAAGSLFVLGSVVAILLGAGGSLLISGFLGLLSTLVAFLTLLYGMVGWGGVRTAGPVLCLLVFAIPLPLNLDRSLIFEMQFLASQLSSWLLDGIGLVHFRNGVVLMTEKSQFMTEEACSGVRSLFSTLAIVAIVSVTLRHRFTRFVGNVLQSLFWVIVGNAIRVCAVVYIADNHTDWVTHGAGHELVGMLVFGFILLMVYSTDALVGLIRSHYLLPYGAELPEQDYDDNDADRAAVQWNPFPIAGRTFTAVIIGSALVTALGLRVAYVRETGDQRAGLAQMDHLAAPDPSDLPSETQGWVLQDFEHIQRQTSFLQAEDSFIWTYRKGPMVARISLDGPWAEWHNLAVCYRGLGWDTQPKYFLSGPGESSSLKTADLRHSELRMRRDDEEGFVIFSSVDRNGQELLPEWRMGGTTLPVSLPRAITRQAAAAIGFKLDAQFAMIGNRLPATTIQLAVMSSDDLNEQQIAAAKELFFQARETLVDTRRFKAPTNN